MYDKKLTIFQYWGIKIIVKLVNLFADILLPLIYWGKGKTVSPVKNDLLLMSATKAAENIRNGVLKSEDIVQAYIDRIIEVESVINAVAEYRFREAIQDAKEVDDLLKSGMYTQEQLKEEKPLLGVPFTVKVLLNVKGLRNTSACVLYKDSPVATTEAPTVTQMKLAGAIVIATSNSAELGFGYETNNPFYGRTNNPYDSNRTAGGSSGGEAALISAAGSVMGLGNDIYGSVRIPALFTGIYSHKPSRGLLVSNIGCNPLPTEITTKFLETGPMCRYVEDLVLMMKILSTNSSEKLQFERQIDFKKLKIFYQINIDDPSVLPVDKEMESAIRAAVDYFATKHGVVAEEINIKLLEAVSIISIPILLADMPNIIQHFTNGKINHMNRIIEPVKYFLGKSKHSIYTSFQAGWGDVIWSKDKIPVCRSLLEKINEKLEDILDENSVFFYPTFVCTAPRHYGMLPKFFMGGFTGLFNLLGFPVTQCPLGLNGAGLPLGMQIVARRNNDPLTIACAQELDKVFGGWIPPS